MIDTKGMEETKLLSGKRCLNCNRCLKPGEIVKYRGLINEKNQYIHQYFCPNCDGKVHDAYGTGGMVLECLEGRS